MMCYSRPGIWKNQIWKSKSAKSRTSQGSFSAVSKPNVARFCCRVFFRDIQISAFLHRSKLYMSAESQQLTIVSTKFDQVRPTFFKISQILSTYGPKICHNRTNLIKLSSNTRLHGREPVRGGAHDRAEAHAGGLCAHASWVHEKLGAFTAYPNLMES